MFRSLFNPGGGGGGWSNGGFSNGSPQSAGSGGTPTSQWGNSAAKKQGGWPSPFGGGGMGGNPNASQWPMSWPHQGQPQQPQQPAPPPTAPQPTPAGTTWQQNWEALQAQQLAGLSGHRLAAEQAKDQRERDWYSQNKSAKWFPYVEKYLSNKYKTAPKPKGGGHGDQNTGGGGGNSGGGTTIPAPTTGVTPEYTAGTFDRDPRAGT